MQPLIQDIAERMGIPPMEAEQAVALILVRVKAALETVGEAEVEGLGTFRSTDGYITFEPLAGFADEINKEFSGMKPVALTDTGDSVEIDDRRSLPGVETDSRDQADASEESEQLQASIELEEEEPAQAELDEPEEVDFEDDEDFENDEDDEDHERAFMYKSPPPPIPSKVRVPPRERRSSHRHRTSASEATEEFPDMASIVSTRPVKPIHNAARARKKSKVPVFVAVAVVVVGLGSWLIFGMSGGTTSKGEKKSENVPSQNASQSTAATSVVEEAPAGEESPAVDTEFSEDAETVLDQTESAVEPQAASNVSEADAGTPSAEEDSRQAPPEESKQEPGPAPSGLAAPITGPVYAWIVASYPSLAEAEDRTNKMRDSGLDANVYEATVRGQPAFRVGVGQFGNEADAWRNHAIVPPEAADAWITRVR